MTPTLRPASYVMSPECAGAAFPTALSFSRSFFRRMIRENWRMYVVRLDLDAEGRGDALYRLTGVGQDFHLLIVSTIFPQNQKVDRSFGINWDVSAALCQGVWNLEREAKLKPEIPKQYLGRYDHDTLCFTRGNRSERIFDDVVEALAGGNQPDPATMASVGYVFRTTAFAGNGMFGMHPYDSMPLDHPLGEPYHLQMAAAFMLREFVFDLIDHLARARSAVAVALDPSIKRYLGLGNSAGQGLIPFIANHPHIMHRWCLTREEAIAEAMNRPANSVACDVEKLLDKAISYFTEDPRDGNGIFTSYSTLAAELQTVRQRLMANTGPVVGDWRGRLDLAQVGLSPETCEVMNTILLEVNPEIVARFETGFRAAETFDIDPAMTIEEIDKLVTERYAWTKPPSLVDHGWTSNFWYHPEEAPDEPRRGRRGIAPEREFESKMDVVLGLERLRAAIKAPCPHTNVAELLATRPELRSLVSRIQSTADMDYAELRQSYVAADYTPFAGERLLLSFYGMEKLDPRPPRSVKGAFLQGAPLAMDIFEGRDGEWPFPLIPHIEKGRPLTAICEQTPLRNLETPEQTPTAIRLLTSPEMGRVLADNELPFYSIEYRKLMIRSLLASGVSLGVAEEVTQMGEFADAVSGTGAGISELLHRLPSLFERERVQTQIRLFEWGASLVVGSEPAFLLLPTALDLAVATAKRMDTGFGAATIDNGSGFALFDHLVFRAAARGMIGLIGWRYNGEEGSTIALPREQGIEIWKNAAIPGWLAPNFTRELAFSGMDAPVSLNPVSRPWYVRSDDLIDNRTVIACLAPKSAIYGAEALAKELRLQKRAGMEEQLELIAADQLRARLQHTGTNGYKISANLFLILESFAKRWLLPENLELKIKQATVPSAN